MTTANTGGDMDQVKALLRVSDEVGVLDEPTPSGCSHHRTSTPLSARRDRTAAEPDMSRESPVAVAVSCVRAELLEASFVALRIIGASGEKKEGQENP